MNNFFKFAKSSGIFFIGNILSKVISFFLLPIYTKYIPTQDYGYYDLSNTYVSAITAILFFDIWTTILRFMYDSDDDKKKYKSVSNGLTIFSISSLIFVLLFIYISCAFNTKYLNYIFLLGLISNIQNVYSFIARGFTKNFEFAVSGIINTIVTAVSNIIMILYLNFDFLSLYISAILGSLTQIIYLEYNIKIIKHIKFNMFDKVLFKSMFIYTLPLGFNSMTNWVLSGYNRIVLSKVMSLDANGIFAIANKFVVMISLVTNCFAWAWQELAFKRGEESDEAGFFSLASSLYFKFLGCGIFILMPMIHFIFPIMVNSNYISGMDIIPLFLISAALSGYSVFVGNHFHAIKNTKVIFISSAVSATFNMVSAPVLIKLFGLNGANLTTMLSFIINIIIRHYILAKIISFKTDFVAIGCISIIVFISSMIYIHCNTAINLIWFIVTIVIFALIFRKYIFSIFKSIKTNKKL